MLGTLWVSLTAYSVRERRGEAAIGAEAARRAKETEAKCMISIWDPLYAASGKEGRGTYLLPFIQHLAETDEEGPSDHSSAYPT